MQRGISFTVYSVLTCTMLHLVAITCPDPELNNDAREFFVRHMRILEECAPSWPMPEMQEQISTLRQAFSADTTKPFELKPSFPFGSPQVPAQSSPLSHEGSFRSRLPSQQSLDQPGQVNYHAHPITPPISATDQDPKADSPVAQSLVMMATGPRAPQSQAPMQMQEPVQWNPQRIIDQWNVAFGTPPPPTTASQASPPLRPPPTGNYEVRTPVEATPPNFSMPNVSPQSNVIQNTPNQIPASASYATPSMPYVTPTMWQEVVASSFPDNLKRRWDHGNQPMVDPAMYKRAR